MIRLCFRVIRDLWLIFMFFWLLVLAFHAAGCSTNPTTRKASAELNKRTFGSGRPALPIRKE